MSKLTAGTACTIINPPIGADLCGYAGRIPGCTGVHDDLQAKALVLSDGKTTGAIVSLDLIGLHHTQVARIRQSASAETGIPAENIFIGASHTHAGPATALLRACGYPNDEFVTAMLGMISDTVIAASRDMRPARFGHGTAESGIAINRRYRAPSGEVQIGENKGGLIDPQVGIWRFTDESGSSIATVFNYACHAVTMGGDNRLVSADWPGAAQRLIEAGIGGQAMFLQGCCGNINPGARGSFDVVEENGRGIAEAVLAALSGMDLVDDPKISIASEHISIPLQPPISLQEAEQTVRDMAAELQNQELPLHTRHLYQAYHDWAQQIIADGGKAQPGLPFEIQRFSVDGAHIVGLPGEVFIEYALNIKQMAPNVMVSAYTNGNVGYVPTRKAFDEGGYEVDLAYKLYGQQKLSPMVETVILAAAGKLFEG